MEDRFLKFTVDISRLNKLIQKLKTEGMELFSLKAAHTSCLYQLMEHKDGLTSAELARQCDLDPALISRTLSDLIRQNILYKEGEPGKYLCKYRLTEKGLSSARELYTLISAIQSFVDEGISQEELEIFYRVLNHLLDRFQILSDDFSLLLPPSEKL